MARTNKILPAAVLSLLITASLLLGSFVLTASADWASYVTPLLTLEAEDGVLGGPARVVGFKVGNIGKCGGDFEGTVLFENLQIPKDGEYTLKFYYCSGSDDRYFQLDSGDGRVDLPCPNTGSFDTVGSVVIDLPLKKGGSLFIGTEWYGPDLDKIEIYEQGAQILPDKNYPNPQNQPFFGENLLLDVKNGVYSCGYNGNLVLKNAHAEARVDGKVLSSDEFTTHEVKDEGATVTFTHRGHPSFDGKLIQTFTATPTHILTTLTVESDTEISSNYLSPLAAYKGSVSLENGVFVQIPFDNDKWVEPKHLSVDELALPSRGYEVGALYDEESYMGLIVGSVSHDIWKTAVDLYGKDGGIAGIAVYGGVSDFGTRDEDPHGSLSGKSISSPTLFLGCFEDYRDGLTAYAKANLEVVPKKDSVKDVPFGFNSWGSMQGTVSYSGMTAVADYIKEHLQEAWAQDGAPVYVNIDSFWDYLVRNDLSTSLPLDEALAAFAAHCKENGQKAGIYFTPFATWLANEEELKSHKMEGSDYTFYDAALRKADGSLYGNSLAGGFALDPTHPGTIARNKERMNYFISLGFEYIKLDFLTHGALEGDHYDKSVKTGLQAYNKAMAEINETVDDKMFINLSIAPVFPYQYADGRRISCDAFGSTDNTAHVLSYLTSCFWQKELYTYPDPDHLIVLGSAEGTARMRVTSAAISGTSFLVGDDLSKISVGSAEHERILAMYANKDVIAVAKLAKTFTPYQTEAGKRCAEIYYLKTADALYLALFNFGGDLADFQLDLNGLVGGLGEELTGYECWWEEQIELDKGVLSYSLPAEDAALIKISEKSDAPVDPPVDPSESPEPSKDPSNVPSEEPSKPATPSAPAVSDEPSKGESKDENGGNNGKKSPVLPIVIGVIAVIAVAGAAVGVILSKKKKG